VEQIMQLQDFIQVVCSKNAPEGLCPTDVACGGYDRRTLYITEAYCGTIVRAHADVPGRPMFSHT